MGQHKYNRNCELAKQGLLPPKPHPMPSRRQQDALLMHMLAERTGINAIMRASGVQQSY